MAVTNSNQNISLNIIFEKGDGELWGRIEHDDFLFTTVGENHQEIVANLKEQLEDFIKHEGAEIEYWKGTNIEEISFEYLYDLAEFFHEFRMLKISSIAQLAGINSSLMRQYTSGVSYPSEKQVVKIQNAITELSKMLSSVQLCVTEN